MKPVYECFEWDNTWIEYTDNTMSPRFLYIGDSISVGTRPAANALADLIAPEELSADYIIPMAFDPRVGPAVAAAVAEAARKTGVARL